MNESKIPVRYARALFMAGKEKGMLEKLSGEVSMLSEFYANTPGIAAWLRSPVIKMQDKKDIWREHFNGQLSDITLKFIDLVITRKRERYFPEIFRDFQQFYKADAGIRTFTLTTASRVDEPLLEKLNRKLKRKGMPDHELHLRVKPSILGGFMLQGDDKLYDASVATRLKKLREELTRQVRGDL